jgi:class 3 adenylate cyclase/YHS domain-containing protein
MASEEIHLAFVIADLSGYTAFTEAHGNREAARTVTRYREIARSAIAPGARLLDSVGDELLIVAEAAADAVRTAIRLGSAIESEPFFPAVRCGINQGLVAEAGDRYYGAALNLTARVAAHARGGQILCTAPVAADAASVEGLCFTPVGRAAFKNVVEPIEIFEIAAVGVVGEGATIDPVCRMQVRPQTAPARLPFAGDTYFFCSFECARSFAERPQIYVRS